MKHSFVCAFIALTSVSCSKEKPTASVSPQTWSVTKVAGSSQGFANGAASVAQFDTPMGLALDSNGDLYVADQHNNRIRKIGKDSIVTTVAGADASGSADGDVSIARFSEPTGIVFGPDGALYITEYGGSKVRKIANGMVTTLAGGIYANGDGVGASAGFEDLNGITIGQDGNLYVADWGNNSIRQVTLSGVVTTFAGSTGGKGGHKDGFRTDALFSAPVDLCFSVDGSLYISESQGDRIRKIDPTGMVSTIAGDGNLGYADSQIGIQAEFFWPYGLAFDLGGTLYVADGGNQTIRKISKTGAVSSIPIIVGGCTSIVQSPDGSFFVSDASNNKILRVKLKK